MEKLKDNQALLLMYLADELPASDKEQLKRKLAVDAALRAELAEIEQAQAACFEALARLDELSGPVIGADAAAGRVGRLMRQWTTGRLARPAVVMRNNQTRLPWWTYPIVSAACAVIALTIYWSLSRHDKNLSVGFGPVISRQDNSTALPNPQWQDTQPASPDTDLAELPADEQVELLNDVGSVSSPEETPNAVAAVTTSSEDVDNVFLGLNPEDRGGTR
jgi:hypothetical protein